MSLNVAEDSLSISGGVRLVRALVVPLGSDEGGTGLAALQPVALALGPNATVAITDSTIVTACAQLTKLLTDISTAPVPGVQVRVCAMLTHGSSNRSCSCMLCIALCA
jgi:hypothetical protein